MLGKLLDFVFWVSNLSSRTSDLLLNEYHGYQWQILWGSFLAAFLMMVTAFVSPSNPVSSGVSEVVSNEALRLVGIGLFATSVMALLVAAWNAIGLFMLIRKYGL